MSRHRLLRAATPLLAALATPALAQDGTPPVAAAQTAQQMFDAAASAVAAGRVDDALAIYAALDARLTKSGAKSLAVVRGRRGVLLVDRGRVEEALPLLRYAQAGLSINDASLRGDRYDISLSFGRIAESRLDYAAARAAYAAAERDASTPVTQRIAISAQARTLMFEDPRAALALADRVLADVTADKGAPRDRIGDYRTLRGRVLLNLHDYRAAHAELKAAVGDLGGLSRRVTLSDIIGRSDLSIAALRAGDVESARRYLAYTGVAGAREVLSTALSSAPPPCGVDDVTPEDVVVVQFAILDDGSTEAIAPIYASRSGASALAFARAVAGWSWAPDAIRTIKPFFRTAIRVEMRCSTVAKKPYVTDLLRQEAEAWMRGKGWPAIAAPGLSPTRERAAAQADLARREAAAGPASPTLLPALVSLMTTATVRADYEAAAARALAIALPERPPPPVLAFLQLSQPFDETDGGAARHAREAKLTALQADPALSADPRTLIALRLLRADWLIDARREREARPVLEAAVADPALDAHDPLKVGALLRLATIRARAGDLAGARTAYDSTGLSGEQCALVDVKPVLTGVSTDEQFPEEAMRWGFEGWTSLEFDVTAEGRPARIRPVVSYPPFVFSDAAARTLSTARFRQSYRPEGGLGCSGSNQRVRFSLPG